MPTAPSLRNQLAALIPDLRGFARFLARDRSEADDLVQEALVRALGALASYQHGTSLRAWLFTIQRNVFYEQARRRRTERAVLAVAIPAGEASVGPHQESEAALADLQRLLWTLPPLLREALVLVGAQGLGYDEAADICGVPVGTMKARVSRARSQIARLAGTGSAAEAVARIGK
jgi:RNA polymerase sigma-70 factor (ECF subfamily)